MNGTSFEDISEHVLRHAQTEHPFSGLVNSVREETGADEATIKAVVLRLNSQGLVELTPDWNVKLPNRQDAA